MKRYIVTLLASVLLLAGMAAGAGAATSAPASSAPSPRCFPLTYFDCSCPPGWHVQFVQGYWQQLLNRNPWCARNRLTCPPGWHTEYQPPQVMCVKPPVVGHLTTH